MAFLISCFVTVVRYKFGKYRRISIGIIFQSAFTIGIRLREVDASLKITGHVLVLGNSPAIVVGDGMHLVL